MEWEVQSNRVVVFNLDELRFAVPLQFVESVIQIVEITEIPDTPEYIEGIVNVHGIVTVVINMRKRMLIPNRILMLEDKLLLVCFHGHSYALMVDEVGEVIELDLKNTTRLNEILPNGGTNGSANGSANGSPISQIAKTQYGMILINDIDALLDIQVGEQIEGMIKR